MEFNNVYEIAKHFDELYQAIPFPSRTDKPSRIDFPNNKNWGEALDRYEEENKKRGDEMKKYHAATNENCDQFKAALLEFLELADHPKADKLFAMAWEEGHSGGYSDVANYAEEFADLLK